MVPLTFTDLRWMHNVYPQQYALALARNDQRDQLSLGRNFAGARMDLISCDFNNKMRNDATYEFSMICTAV